MSELTTTDPKFVPAAAQLQIVQMKVGDLKTDEAMIAFAGQIQFDRQLRNAQEAVIVYTARKRGRDFDWILTNLGIKSETAASREVEGMAILRLQEYTRCVAAIRVGSLGVKAVDEITGKPKSVNADDVDERILALETLAVAKNVKRRFVSEEKGKELTDAQVAQVVKAATAHVETKAEPITAGTIAGAVSDVAETQQITVKPRATKGNDNAEKGPFSIEHHMKAALADVLALEAAAEEQYTLTPHDFAALFALLEHVRLSLELSDEVIAAIEVVEKAGL